MTVVNQVNKITKTIKNVARLRQIVGVFAKHGFADFLRRTNLISHIPARFLIRFSSEEDMSVVKRLRLAFEELGPTFVKLGQVLSNRPDLFSQEFINEMKKLQDHVQPFSFQDVRSIFRLEFSQQPEEIFSFFSEVPMAAASIAQVHAARTKEGADVVVKIQRPHIQKEIRKDMEILALIARLLENSIPESRVFTPKAVIAEFWRSIREETDFRIEANNIRRIKENLKEFSDIIIPNVHATYSTSKILTLDRIHGRRADDVEGMKKTGININRVVERGMDCFLQMVLVDGLFHSDLHAGNILILDDGRIGLIDFGIVGRLTQRMRDQLVYLFLALFSENYEALSQTILDMAPTTPERIDIDMFQKDLVDSLSPYYGMNMKEVAAGHVLIETSTVAARHHLTLPRDFILLFRALLAAQGMATTLYPEFDIVTAATKHIDKVLAVRYSKKRLTQDALLLARDSFELIQTLPRHLRLLTKRLLQHEVGFKIYLPHLNPGLRFWGLQTHSRMFFHGAILFIAIGYMKLETTLGPRFLDLSVFVWLCFLASVVCAFLSLIFYFRSSRALKDES